MAGRKKVTPEVVEGEIVSEVANHSRDRRAGRRRGI